MTEVNFVVPSKYWICYISFAYFRLAPLATIMQRYQN